MKHYSKAQVKKENRRLTIIFAPDTAEVVQADTFGCCGLGVNLSAFTTTRRRGHEARDRC
jgi:hypothetical protein